MTEAFGALAGAPGGCPASTTVISYWQMSLSGQTLQSQSSPTAQLVRCWSDGDHTSATPRTTLRAKLRHRQCSKPFRHSITPSASRFLRDQPPAWPSMGEGRRVARARTLRQWRLTPRVRSDLTRSIFSTILRIYQIGNFALQGKLQREGLLPMKPRAIPGALGNGGPGPAGFVPLSSSARGAAAVGSS